MQITQTVETLSAINETISEISNISPPTISTEKEETVVPEKKKTSIGFGLNFDDIAKEIEVEEALKSKEKIPVTEDHACAVIPEENEEEKTLTISSNINTDELNEKNLAIVWKKMMDWFKTSEQMSLYELLFNNLPTLKEENDLLLILDSDVEKEVIKGSLGLIKGFLKRNFKEFNQLYLEVTTCTKSKKIILNQKDKYYLSIKKNPFLDKLRIELDLELEM